MRPHPQEKLRDMGVELPAGGEGNPGFLRGAAVQCNSNRCTRGTLGPADAGWLWCCREQWKASVKRLWSTCAIGIKTTRVGHRRDFGLENLQKRSKCWCPVYSPFQNNWWSVISDQAEACCVEGGLRLDKHRRSESVVESTISSIQFKEE